MLQQHRTPHNLPTAIPNTSIFYRLYDFVHGRITASFLETYLQSLSDQEWRSVDKKNNSILHAACFITGEIYSRREESAEAQRLMGILLEIILQTKKKPELQRFLFVFPCDRGLTSLHKILITGKSKNLEFYLQELRKAYECKAFTAKEYADFLFWATENDSTPLLFATFQNQKKWGQAQIVKFHLFFKELEWVLQKNIIPIAEYAHLFVKPSKDNITTLFSALNTKQFAIIKLFFEELQKLVTHRNLAIAEVQNVLTLSTNHGFKPIRVLFELTDPGELQQMVGYFRELLGLQKYYKQLLVADEISGFTPLLHILKGNLPEENLNILLREIHDGIEDEFIQFNDYFKNLLITVNGFNALHICCMYNSSSYIFLFYKILLGAFNKARRDGLVAESQIEDFVTAQCYGDDSKENILHRAVRSQQMDIVFYLVSFIRSLFADAAARKVVWRLLNSLNKDGVGPLALAEDENLRNFLKGINHCCDPGSVSSQHEISRALDVRSSIGSFTAQESSAAAGFATVSTSSQWFAGGAAEEVHPRKLTQSYYAELTFAGGRVLPPPSPQFMSLPTPPPPPSLDPRYYSHVNGYSPTFSSVMRKERSREYSEESGYSERPEQKL